MNSLLSLKYRIAITIFILEVIMLTVVLDKTQSLSYELAKAEIAKQDAVILETLADVSADALILTNYTGIQPLFLKIAESEHIILVSLTDYRERVVSSSDIASFGKELEVFPQESNYLKSIIIEDYGELTILFSGNSLAEAKEQSLTLGLQLSISGMAIIAIVGLLLGHLLTRRLNSVINHTKLLADGGLDQKLTISGKDEIAFLAQSLNTMSHQLTESFKEIEYLAYHDSLTQLTNRAEFSNQLYQLVTAAKTLAESHSVMFLDLDQFKIVNDSCGHQAGDELLVLLSKEIAKVLKPSDVLARLGGDEFGILLKYCDLKQAEIQAEKVRSQIEKFEFDWNKRTYKVGVSIGLVVVDEHCESVKSVMSLADMACYEAKDKGGNAIVVTANKSQESLLRATDIRLVSKLTEAIDKDRWLLHFQRIVSLKDDESLLYGEFLLRLNIDDVITSPGEYIEAAERYQLMTKIDTQTVTKVFKLLSDLPENKRPKISFINLSGQTIGSSTFLNHVIDLLGRYKLAAETICFEITETSAVNNEELAIEFIQQLRAVGFKFALDDFGSGFTGFNYLKTMPVDIVKIEGLYVSEMLKNKIDYQIVSSVNDTAHTAGLMTIAEYVEEPETMVELKKLGIDFAQGYGIHEPESLVHYLATLKS